MQEHHAFTGKFDRNRLRNRMLTSTGDEKTVGSFSCNLQGRTQILRIFWESDTVLYLRTFVAEFIVHYVIFIFRTIRFVCDQCGAFPKWALIIRIAESSSKTAYTSLPWKIECSETWSPDVSILFYNWWIIRKRECQEKILLNIWFVSYNFCLLLQIEKIVGEQFYAITSRLRGRAIPHRT